jgi:hypothetical protein
MNRETTVTFPGPGTFKITFTPMEAKPEPVRHWVTSPVIGETIEVATKADFSDVIAGVVEYNHVSDAIHIRLPNGCLMMVPMASFHTRRPVDTRPWYERLNKGDRIRAARDERFGTFVRYDKDYPRVWWRCDGEDLDTWGHPDYFAPLPPADRRTLPCFENCIVGDEVEYNVWNGSTGKPFDPPQWKRTTVKHRGDGVVWVDGGVAARWNTRDEIRWPQSDAAPVADWEAAFKKLQREHEAMIGVVAARGEIIAAKDAEIARHVSDNHQLINRCADHEKTIAELRAACSDFARDVVKADVEAKTLRAQLATVEAANKATVADYRAMLETEREKVADLEELLSSKWQRGAFEKYQRALVSIGDVLGVTWGETSLSDSGPMLLAAIASLKSESRLVLPVEVLAHHPLPWRRDGMVIYSGHTKVISTCTPTGSYGYDVSIAAAIVEAVNAANRAVKS